MNTTQSNLRGIAYLILALLIMSLQGIAVKFIGGDYSIMQIVLLRSIVALPASIVLFRLEGKRGLPTTKRPGLEYLRGLCLFVSYTMAFMGLASLPLGEYEAIRFSAPLMITVLSVFMLGEKVGIHRWLALFVGFAGVLIMVRPGSAGFNLGSVFVLVAMLFYALSVMLTRKLQTTDSSATMGYYSTVLYLAAAMLLSPLVLLVGEMPDAHPGVAFLFRGWAMPTPLDAAIMAGLGLIWVGGMYFVARAYSTAQASMVASFEYVSLPISVMWGFLIWHEIPTWTTWVGAGLTLAAGLYILNRERQQRAKVAVTQSFGLMESEQAI